MFFWHHKWWLLSGFFLMLVDQVSKVLAAQWWGVSLNDGATLGLGAEWGRGVMVVVQSLVVLVVAAAARRPPVSHPTAQKWWRVGLALMLTGGVSNLVDRLLLGAVRDWLTWPGLGFSNNLADCYIALGVAMVAMSCLVQYWYGKSCDANHSLSRP